MLDNVSSEEISNRLRTFSNVYEKIHIPLSLTICIFGSVANVLNILVLTRKHMRTPTNVLLTGLSFAQLALVLNYIGLQNFEIFRNNCSIGVWTEQGAWYKFVNVNLNIVFHTTAFAHTVCLALFRVVAIRWPLFARSWMNTRRARIWSLIMYAAVPVLCVPVFLSSNVEKVDENVWINCTHTQILVEAQYDLDMTKNELILSLVLWEFGVLLKLVPSFLIVSLSLILILSLRQVENRKRRLKHGVVRSSSDCKRKLGPNHEKSSVKARTTRMLVAIALLCVTVEFPLGILHLLSDLFGQEYWQNVNDKLGDFFEMLTLLYSSVNFVLLCAMSTEFLMTFSRFFCPLGIQKRLYYRRQMSFSKTADIIPTETVAADTQKVSANQVVETKYFCAFTAFQMVDQKVDHKVDHKVDQKVDQKIEMNAIGEEDDDEDDKDYEKEEVPDEEREKKMLLVVRDASTYCVYESTTVVI